jgi:hypothetical protein
VSLIDEIRKILEGENKNQFIEQILKEQAFYEALHKTGLTITVADPTERGRLLPYGVLSKVQKIDLIDLIDVINDIKLIEEITHIGTIASVGLIEKAVVFNFPIEKIVNGGLEDSPDFTGWINNGCSISTDDFHSGSKSAYMVYSCNFYQNLDVEIGNITTFKAWVKKGAGNGNTYFEFTSDAGTQSVLFDGNVSGYDWTEVDLLAMMLSAGAYGTLTQIKFLRMDDTPINFWVDDVSLIAYPTTLSVAVSNLLNPHPVSLVSIPNPPNLDVALSTRFKPSDSIGNTTFGATQPTRTSLKAQTEREDLLCKSFDLAVGTTSLLGAVGSQYHKVYGWDYEADTDGANEFSATINATANTKFARRITKGVHAMTLVHPIVCDVNTALSFISAGNTKLSLRYKTEA